MHHWIGLSLWGDGVQISRDAAGTQVFVTYQDERRRVRQMREVQIVNGLSAQSDRRLLFGLGGYPGPVRVEVHWYGAAPDVYDGLALDRYHTLRYGAGLLRESRPCP